MYLFCIYGQLMIIFQMCQIKVALFSQIFRGCKVVSSIKSVKIYEYRWSEEASLLQARYRGSERDPSLPEIHQKQVPLVLLKIFFFLPL